MSSQEIGRRGWWSWLAFLVLVGAARADVVTSWNGVTMGAIRRDTVTPGPTWASRNLAMVHVAIYDAVNAVTQTHDPYAYRGGGQPLASVEAAAAQAAFGVLKELYPDPQRQLPFFEYELARTLARIPAGASKEAGIALGQEVADELLTRRANDGSRERVDYQITNAPGHWQPDPRAASVEPLGANWGGVTPFVVTSATQFVPPAPPTLTSEAYATAFEEVKEFGDRRHRGDPLHDELTQVGLFWGYDRAEMGPAMIMYNQVVRTIAEQQENTLDENARLFALANLAQADAGIAAWASKFDPANDFWRPITAIRAAATDGNAATTADPTWEPLGAPGGWLQNGHWIDHFTPPFPAYVSGHAAFGSAAMQVIRDFYGTDDISFSLTSDEVPGITRHYDSLSEAMDENGRSRIYLGIHWEFDNQAGQALGRDVADYVFAHALRPVGNDARAALIPEPSAWCLTVGLAGGVLSRVRRRSTNGGLT